MSTATVPVRSPSVDLSSVVQPNFHLSYFEERAYVVYQGHDWLDRALQEQARRLDRQRTSYAA